MAAFEKGPQLYDPEKNWTGGAQSFVNGIVATAGGGRGGAFPIGASMNRITTCATAADSVALPPAVGGQKIMLVNSGAASCQVFAAVGTTDTINGTAGATGIAFAAAAKAEFFSPGPGLWFSNLSA